MNNFRKNIFLIVVATLTITALAFFFFAKDDAQNLSSNVKTNPPQEAPTIPVDGDYKQLSFPDNTLDTRDWQTYRSEEFGFEVRYPKDIVTVSGIRSSEMKEMYEFGFYLNWHLGRVDITMRTAKIGINIYVYGKDVDTMFKIYSDLNKSPSNTVGSIPINNTNLFFLVANKDSENGDLFRYQRAYFAGDREHAYEIVPTQIPDEHKKIFQGIISSFKLIK
ncbi:MAG: hypothetical protein HZB09_02770 [Candidatus Yonathbacteria bacterium]|nr:hypothetical protein [Candidatus Yonathbacteria bacterium]